MTYPTATETASPSYVCLPPDCYNNPEDHPRECNSPGETNPYFPPCDCAPAGPGIICGSNDYAHSTPPATSTPAPTSSAPITSAPPTSSLPRKTSPAKTKPAQTHTPPVRSVPASVTTTTPAKPQLASTGATPWLGLEIGFALIAAGLALSWKRIRYDRRH